MAFFSIYPTTNWLTGLRSTQYSLFVEQELALPFVPGFIWLYLSMYVLFLTPPFFLSPSDLKCLAKELISATCIGGLIFLLLPARLGFERVLPPHGLYRELFGRLFAIDQPYNLVPSLHVVYSTAIALAVCANGTRWIRLAVLTWLALVVTSTVLVHQHHVLDVLAGIILALSMRSYWRGKHA